MTPVPTIQDCIQELARCCLIILGRPLSWYLIFESEVIESSRIPSPFSVGFQIPASQVILSALSLRKTMQLTHKNIIVTSGCKLTNFKHLAEMGSVFAGLFE